MPAAPLRDRFPLLEDVTYLASHSLGAVPESAREALNEYHDAWATKGIQAWDGPWWEAVERFNEQIEAVLNAPPGTVAPMTNVTRAIAGFTSALSPEGGRDTILMTDLEFTTSYPLIRGLEEIGFNVEIVESQDGITVDPARIAEAITNDTLLVHTCHVYFRSGALQDIRAITEAAHDEGAYMLADGYQSVGTVPTDVQGMGVDAFVGGSHKWLCGGPGAGYLYVAEDLAEDLDPRLRGWFGLEDPFAYEDVQDRGQPASGARRFLGGTPNVPGLYAAREGVKAVREVGPERIRERSLSLTNRVLVHADAQDLTVRTPRDEEDRGGMVCVDFEGSQKAAEALKDQGFLVDWRPDCGIRISPHFYNTEAEVDRLFQALIKIR